MRKALFFLGVLSDSDIDWMAQTGARKEITAGEVLIHEGKPTEAMYVVLDGAFSVYVEALGNKNIARLLCGEVVGEMSFVQSRPPSATVKADTDSLVLSVPRTLLALKLEEDVQFAARFYRALAIFLADRVRSTVMRLGYGKAEQASEDVELDSDVLDNVALAGARFEWLLRRLRGDGALR